MDEAALEGCCMTMNRGNRLLTFTYSVRLVARPAPALLEVQLLRCSAAVQLRAGGAASRCCLSAIEAFRSFVSEDRGGRRYDERERLSSEGDCRRGQK